MFKKKGNPSLKSFLCMGRGHIYEGYVKDNNALVAGWFLEHSTAFANFKSAFNEPRQEMGDGRGCIVSRSSSQC